MRRSIAIDVEAPAALVFALARDIPAWPRLLPHYHRVTLRERHADGSLTCEMVARRPLIGVLGLGLPVAWRARTSSEPETLGLRFSHVGGATRGMEVTWRIEPAAAGCHVSIEHDYGARLRTWGPLIDRLFVRPIAGRTLATFKSIAEAVAAAQPPASPEGKPRSKPRSAPKTST